MNEDVKTLEVADAWKLMPGDLHDGIRAINTWLNNRDDHTEVLATLAFLNSYWGVSK